MADPTHTTLLLKNLGAWNDWRKRNPSVIPDLRCADLCDKNLSGADLSRCLLHNASLRNSALFSANLCGVQMCDADLYNCRICNGDLSASDLRRSSFWCADLDGANFADSDLSGASLRFADLANATFTRADLTGAELVGAQLVDTVLDGADLSRCHVYGASAWSCSLMGTIQKELVVTKKGEPAVTVDDLQVAQFVFLLLNNSKLRDVLDTLGKKGVLILGRFTPERKQILDGIRECLRNANFVPMMFDFERAQRRDFTETIKVLAGLSRFVVADITNPSSAPLELQATVPDYMVPFLPIIQRGEQPFAMFVDLQNKYPWVLDVLEYRDADELRSVIDRGIIQRAIQKDQELLLAKAEGLRRIRAADLR